MIRTWKGTNQHRVYWWPAVLNFHDDIAIKAAIMLKMVISRVMNYFFATRSITPNVEPR